MKTPCDLHRYYLFIQVLLYYTDNCNKIFKKFTIIKKTSHISRTAIGTLTRREIIYCAECSRFDCHMGLHCVIKKQVLKMFISVLYVHFVYVYEVARATG